MARTTESIAIFDFDGTIANTFPLVLRVLTAHRESQGQTGPSEEEIEELRKIDSRKVFEFLGIPRWKVPFVIAAVRHRMRKIEHELESFDGMHEALALLVERGWRLFILSSNGTRTIRTFFERHGLPRPVKIEGGVRFFGKEHRLRRLMRDFNLDPERTVLVGDETRDMSVGRLCGTKTVGVTWGLNVSHVLETESPDALVDSPRDLPATLERLLPGGIDARE
jgi:phosphoglycolate phosphatase